MLPCHGRGQGGAADGKGRDLGPTAEKQEAEFEKALDATGTESSNHIATRVTNAEATEWLWDCCDGAVLRVDP